MTGKLPHFFRYMGSNGGQHQQEFLDTFPPGIRVNAGFSPYLAQVVNQFHQGGNGGIELEPVKVVVAFAYCLMQDANRIPHRLGVSARRIQILGVALYQTPDPV